MSKSNAHLVFHFFSEYKGQLHMPMEIPEIHSNETMTYLPAGGMLMSVLVMKTASLACKMQNSGEFTGDPTSIYQ